MAKTTIADGQDVLAAFFNAVNNPQFNKNVGDELFDGQNYRLTDDALSNDATQIKTRFTTLENGLLVTAGSGLTANYSTGSVILPTGAIATVAASSILVTNNATTTIYVDTSGVVGAAIAASLPTTRLDLAQITAVGGAITAIVDLRGLGTRKILPPGEAIKVFGGSGDQGDYIVSGTQTLSEAEYWFKNFTVPNGTTLNISTATKIYCSGTVSIAGNIIVATSVYAGSATISSSNSFFQSPGSGQGRASDLFGGNAYNYTASILGSGGASGTASGTSGAAYTVSVIAGAGAGAISIEAGGSISITNTATITAKGQNATATNISNSSGLSTATGSGGGSGGLISLKSLRSITVAGTLDVRGGNGSAAVQAGTNIKAFGGGGGGGGIIVLFAPSVNTTGSTIQLAGGAAGASVTNGTPSASVAGGGGGGFGGAGGNQESAGSVGLLLTRTIRPTV